MVEKGVVTKRIDNLATVSFNRKGKCDKCRLCSVSNDCTKVEIKVENTLDLNEGDYVAVDMGKRGLYTAAALVYLVPVALIVIGILIGSLLSPLAQAILSVGGLIVGLSVALPVDLCVIRKSKKFVPKMIEILEENPLEK